MKKMLVILLALVVLSAGGAFFTYQYIKSTLPKLVTVNDYEPLLVSKVYDRNGKLIGEFFNERRVLTPYKNIPKNLVNAFLAAEDDTFFKHSGVNYLAIMRAAIANIQAGHSVQGGSTITQQVAKTLLLSSEKTLIRKLKDVVLAQEMEAHLSKEDILYLYLNQIFFGQNAHGVAMAAETYFRKPVQKLSLAEMAILAGLPKAPSAYSPVKNPSRAKERQVYVLHRMAEVGFITAEEAKAAAAEPVKVYLRETFATHAPFFLETVRLQLFDTLGGDAVNNKGLRIYTSLDLDKQQAAQKAVEQGLKDLDKRQGYRGPLKNVTEPKEVGEFLLKSRNDMIAEVIPERIIEPTGKFKDYGPLNLQYNIKKGLPFYLKIGTQTQAIVSKVDDNLGLVFVKIAELDGLIDIDTMMWARKPNPQKRYDLDTIKKPSLALKMGDIIMVKVTSDKFFSQRLNKILAAEKKAGKTPSVDLSHYITLELDQEPTAEAALLSLDQQNQDVIAMVGGYDFEKSKFNRALQAARQTGSSFKSIVYASALDRGYTASTPIMDAPVVFDEGGKENTDEGQDDSKTWRPSNHSKSFGGDIILRNALVKSLNVPSVKIIEDLTVPYAADYAKRLGIFSPLNMDFTLVLGSSSVTLYEMTKAFSQFGRNGKRIHPVVIHRVENHLGQKILDKTTLDQRFSKETEEQEKQFEDRRQAYLESLKTLSPEEAKEKYKKSIDPHIFFEDPEQLIRPSTAYLTTSLLKSVVEDKSGTGGRAKALGREVAGKTGTTNGYFDAWFIGYTPQIATGVWVGFDHEKTLGIGEVGGRSALPMWVEYMKAAHDNLPQMTFPVPEGIVFVNIDSDTGKLASATSKNIVRQAFLEGTEPTAARDRKEEDTDFYKQDLTE